MFFALKIWCQFSSWVAWIWSKKKCSIYEPKHGLHSQYVFLLTVRVYCVHNNICKRHKSIKGLHRDHINNNYAHKIGEMSRLQNAVAKLELLLKIIILSSSLTHCLSLFRSVTPAANSASAELCLVWIILYMEIFRFIFLTLFHHSIRSFILSVTFF